MSEQEEIILFDRIRECISTTQRKMVERKALLGEKIVIADADGRPIEILASDALKLYQLKQ